MSSKEQTSEEGQEAPPVGDIDALKEALAREEARAEEFLANWKRAQADFINYKRRSEQASAETVNLAKSILILTLLPVLDDLERALNSAPPHLAKDPWVDGITPIERKFRAVLEAQGLSPIKAVGEPFDPNLHEAAMHEKGKEGIVLREIYKGYKLGDRVLRPVGVVVGSGEEEEKPAP